MSQLCPKCTREDLTPAHSDQLHQTPLRSFGWDSGTKGNRFTSRRVCHPFSYRINELPLYFLPVPILARFANIPKMVPLGCHLEHTDAGLMHPHFSLHPPQLHRRKFPLFLDQGSQQNRLARSPVPSRVGKIEARWCRWHDRPRPFRLHRFSPGSCNG